MRLIRQLIVGTVVLLITCIQSVDVALAQHASLENAGPILAEHFKAAAKKNRRALAKLRIAEVMGTVLQQHDAALEYFLESIEDARSSSKRKRNESLIDEAQKGYELALESKFSSIELPVTRLFAHIDYNSRYYRKPSKRKSDLEGRKVDRKEAEVVRIENGFCQASFSQGAITKMAWFALEDVRSFSITTGRQRTLQEMRESYEAFIQSQQNTPYVAKAIERMDSIRFAQATQANTLAELEEYLHSYPNGKYLIEAKFQIENIHFDGALRSESPDKIEMYLNQYPNGHYHDFAKVVLDEARTFSLARESNTVDAYQLFRDAYPGGWFSKRALLNIDTLDFNTAKSVDTKESYQIYADKHPDGIHLNEALERTKNFMRQDVRILPPKTEYFDDGAMISGTVVNDNTEPVHVIATIRFETETERIQMGSSFLGRNQYEVYEGRSYVEDISLTVPARSRENFSKRFNTVARGRYQGLILDLFNTERSLRKRLSIKRSPNISLRFENLDDRDVVNGNTEAADEYLEQARNVKSSDGIENLLDLLGSFVQEPGGKSEAYRLKAQIRLAEDAVRVAPRYVSARLALANYLYRYAGLAVRPTTIFENYRAAYEHAHLAAELDPKNSAAKELVERARRGAELHALQAGVSVAVMEKLSGKPELQAAAESEGVTPFKRQAVATDSSKASIRSSDYVILIAGRILCRDPKLALGDVVISLWANEWRPLGKLPVQSNGHFKFTTPARTGGFASFRFHGECGEQFLRTDHSLTNLSVLLKR